MQQLQTMFWECLRHMGLFDCYRLLSRNWMARTAFAGWQLLWCCASPKHQIWVLLAQGVEGWEKPLACNLAPNLWFPVPWTYSVVCCQRRPCFLTVGICVLICFYQNSTHVYIYICIIYIFDLAASEQTRAGFHQFHKLKRTAEIGLYDDQIPQSTQYCSDDGRFLNYVTIRTNPFLIIRVPTLGWTSRKLGMKSALTSTTWQKSPWNVWWEVAVEGHGDVLMKAENLEAHAWRSIWVWYLEMKIRA